MANDDISDVELVDLVVRGHPGAFRRFYQRHSRLIYGCVRKRANPADVDDVFQAFFERLAAKDYRPLQMWQRGTSLPVYLAKVVRNFVVDFYRARRSREEAIGGAAEIDALLDPQEETLSLKGHLNELRRLGIKACIQVRTLSCSPSLRAAHVKWTAQNRRRAAKSPRSRSIP